MLWNQFALTADASSPDRTDADNREHGQIVAALEAHDPVTAERLVRLHIDQSKEALLKHLSAMR
jgi:DNA-binding GntR family transcriptional regulator